MNIEPTEQQRLRSRSMACMACGGPINIGRNYPEGLPLPRTLELWCPACRIINAFICIDLSALK